MKIGTAQIAKAVNDCITIASQSGDALWCVCVRYALDNPEFITAFREHLRATRHPLAICGGIPRVTWCKYVASVTPN